MKTFLCMVCLIVMTTSTFCSTIPLSGSGGVGNSSSIMYDIPFPLSSSRNPALKLRSDSSGDYINDTDRQSIRRIILAEHLGFGYAINTNSWFNDVLLIDDFFKKLHFLYTAHYYIESNVLFAFEPVSDLFIGFDFGLDINMPDSIQAWTNGPTYTIHATVTMLKDWDRYLLSISIPYSYAFTPSESDQNMFWAEYSSFMSFYNNQLLTVDVRAHVDNTIELVKGATLRLPFVIGFSLDEYNNHDQFLIIPVKGAMTFSIPYETISFMGCIDVSFSTFYYNNFLQGSHFDRKRANDILVNAMNSNLKIGLNADLKKSYGDDVLSAGLNILLFERKSLFSSFNSIPGADDIRFNSTGIPKGLFNESTGLSRFSLQFDIGYKKKLKHNRYSELLLMFKYRNYENASVNNAKIIGERNEVLIGFEYGVFIDLKGDNVI